MFSSINIFSALASTPAPPTALANIISKKKRRRNKKKKSVSSRITSGDNVPDNDEDDDDDDDLDPDTEDLKYNSSEMTSGNANEMRSYEDDPITKTIDEIMRISNFERSKVHAIVTKMWDSGLHYDDPEAVIEQLAMQEDCDTAIGDECQNTKLIEEISKVSISTYLPQENGFDINIGNFTATTVVNASTVAVTTDNGTYPHDQFLETRSPTILEASLPARLEAAAAHPDLPEALAALCVWASMSDSDGLKDFFNARALEIILQRILSESAESLTPEIRSSLTTLLQTVLRLPASSSGSAAVSAFVTSLEILKSQVLSLKSLIPEAASGQGFLAASLAHRIGTSVRRLNAVMVSLHSGGSVQVTIANVDAALADTIAAIDKHADEFRGISSRQSTNIDLKSIFMQRELLHERLQLELQAAEALREAALRPRSALSMPSLGGNVEDDESLESAVLAEVRETRESIAVKKSQAQFARTYVDRVMQEHDAIRNSLGLEIKACNDHICVLQNRYDDLVLQLQRIEREVLLASAKRTSLQTKLVEEQKRYDERLSSLDGAQGQVMAALRIEDGARSLVARVHDLEGSLASVVAGVQRPLGPPAEEYPVRVAAASDALGCYVESEAKCISALATRVNSVENRLQLLRREAEEYRALDMQTIGAEIEGTIQKLTDNAIEDSQTLNALRNALSESIQRFTSCLTVDLAGVGMVAMPTLALEKAVASLLEAGVAVPNELTPFIRSTSVVGAPMLGPPPGLGPIAAAPQPSSPSVSAHAATSPVVLAMNRTSFQHNGPAKQLIDVDATVGASTPRAGNQATKPAPGKAKKSAPPSISKTLNQPLGKVAKAAPLGARSVLKPAAPSAAAAPAATKSSWAGWKVPTVAAVSINTPDSGSHAEISYEEEKGIGNFDASAGLENTPGDVGDNCDTDENLIGESI